MVRKPPAAQMPLLQLLTPAALQRMRAPRFRATVAAAQANPTTSLRKYERSWRARLRFGKRGPTVAAGGYPARRLQPAEGHLAVVLTGEQGCWVERLADKCHRAVRLQQVLGRPSMAEEGQRRHR